MKVRLQIQLIARGGDPFMGIGPVWLLQRVKKFRSISLAARDMRMSYAKAHKLLKSFEKHLGRRMLIRRRGGADRGGAELTPYAERFISGYAAYQARVGKFAEKELAGFLRSLKG